MTPGEFREIVKIAREFGLSRVKIGDVEIECGGAIGNAASESETLKTSAMFPVEQSTNPIEHKVEQLASLMKLGDVALIDALFPDHTEQDDEASA